MNGYPLALAVVLLAAPLVLAQPTPSTGERGRRFDWPQWRGPNRDGTSPETGLLKRWPNEGPPLVWQAKELGGGYSTPSVAAGRIFGMSYRGADEVVWALRETDGKELWVRRIAAKGKAPYNEGPRSTPTVDGDRVYALGISGDLVCLKADTGETVWSRNFDRDFGGSMMSSWGYSESVLVDGRCVICTPGGERKAAVANKAIVALDKRDGAEVWACDVPRGGGASYSSPIKAEAGGLTMYVTLLGKTGGVVGVRAKDGKLLWQYTRVSNSTANIPTVLFHDGYLVCSTGYPEGGYAVLRVVADGERAHVDEVEHHPAKVLQNHHGGMVRVGDSVYLGRGQSSGLPTCVEFQTGRIVWKEERGPGTGSAAVAAADGMLYFRYEDGQMALLEATPKRCHMVSTFKLPDLSGKPSWPHPVIANGKLLIRDQDRLTCFNVKTAPW